MASSLRFFRFVLALQCCLAVSAASAQNLLDNGEFDVADGEAGWSLLAGEDFVWQPLDRDDCPESGSLLLTYPALGRLRGSGAIVRSTCMVLPPGVTAIHVAFEWTGSDNAVYTLARFSDVDCAGSSLVTPLGASGSPTAWNRVEQTFAATSPVAVRLEIGFLAGTFLEASFDRIHLGLQSPVHVDDFEGGSDCRWSFTE